MQQILLNNFHLGGISDSGYSGIPNSLASIVGCDLHSEPGVLKCSQALTKDSGATVDDSISKIVVCSDTKAYHFGKTAGKIWSRTTGGAWALEATNANPGGILNAKEYDGYIYYAGPNWLGRVAVGAAWGTRVDSWKAFLSGNANYHPMFIKNNVLYIGDGHYVAQVDAGVFTDNALPSLENKYIVESLGEVDSDLLIGCNVHTIVAEAKVFRWNTIQISYTNDDNAPENGVNCFLPVDNYVLLQAGQKGNLYTYDGSQMSQFKRIPGNWTSTNRAKVFSEAAVNYSGLPLFGLSNDNGNPALQGVYSFGSYSANYPKVLTLEYVISTGNTSNIEIGAIAIQGNDILVSWKDSNGGTSYGVDKVDWSNKRSGAYFETRVITTDRMNAKNMKLKIAYRSLPANTSITLQKKINNGAYTNVTLLNEALKSYYSTDVNVSDANTAQFKITMVGSGNNAPEIEAVEIVF